MMQPVAVITSPASGILYINGRIAGETGPDVALTIPLTPNGAIYMQLFPFGRRYRPGAYRLDLKNGEISANAADDTCRILIWPGHIIEISLMPLTAVPAESEYSILDGIPAAILRGEASLLRIGQNSVALPESASLPDNHIKLNGANLYTGRAGDRAYIALFNSDDLTPINAITADRITIAEGKIITATELKDAADHLRIDTYEPTGDSLKIVSTSISARHVPETAESTAIAAAEAALLGLSKELDEYLQPDSSLDTANIDGVLPMKYCIPGIQTAIGLLKRITPFAAQVTPQYYTASMDDDKWQIRFIKK